MHHFSQGNHTKQAHKAIPDGHYEEEQGLLGFFGRVSHLIKRKPSTRWTNIEGPLKPHMYDPMKIKESEKLVRMLYNDQCEISLLQTEPNGLRSQISFRDADGDLLYFCHDGEGEFLTEYGSLKFNKGMYVIILHRSHHFISKTF